MPDRYMAALVWLHRNDPQFDDAEFIVRAARPSRWPGARFEPSDVDRAARAIASDPGYLNEVARDAKVTARTARVGLAALSLAVNRLRREAPDA